MRPHLAVLGIWQAQHSHLGDARVLQQRALDVQRRNLQELVGQGAEIWGKRLGGSGRRPGSCTLRMHTRQAHAAASCG